MQPKMHDKLIFHVVRNLSLAIIVLLCTHASLCSHVVVVVGRKVSMAYFQLSKAGLADVDWIFFQPYSKQLLEKRPNPGNAKPLFSSALTGMDSN